MPVSLSIISAMDENRLIGCNNALPWHMPADFAFFKKTTWGKPILMGRKTYESIGKPLPGRQNIIISRNADYRVAGCDTVNSLDSALQRVAEEPEAMLIGGASLYSQYLHRASQLYITLIHNQFDGDAWFPAINPDIWVERWREEHKADNKNPYSYSFIKYARS